MVIGHIEEIVRHPVKSFYGESVKKTNVMEYGLYGDRSHAFLDEKRSGKYLTITQYTKMAGFKARFLGEESMESYPLLEITTPAGKVVHWGDVALKQEVENGSNRKVSFKKFTPSHVPFGAIEEEHIQLVSDASVNRLKELWGKEIDHRRFRPNLLISLKDKIPFVEETWFGKKIKIGNNVELRLKRHCVRCMIITVDPESTEMDASLLKTVVKERRQNFGVYASVVRTGEIRAGDEVVLFD